MDSSTKIPNKIKTVSRVMQKSNATGTFYYSNATGTFYFKHCFQKEFSSLLVCGGNAEFHCLDGKRFADKLDRYITTIVLKDGRRCKCII